MTIYDVRIDLIGFFFGGGGVVVVGDDDVSIDLVVVYRVFFWYSIYK